jgi:hypothetical protein
VDVVADGNPVETTRPGDEREGSVVEFQAMSDTTYILRARS